MLLGTSLKKTHAPRRMSEGGLVKTMLGPRDSVASLLRLLYLLLPYYGILLSPRGNSGRSGNASNSSSDAAEDAFENCYSQVQTFPKCKVTTEMMIETQLNYRDLMIGIEGSNFVLRNLNELSRYHYTLEYERFLIIIRHMIITSYYNYFHY